MPLSVSRQLLPVTELDTRHSLDLRGEEVYFAFVVGYRSEDQRVVQGGVKSRGQ